MRTKFRLRPELEGEIDGKKASALKSENVVSSEPEVTCLRIYEAACEIGLEA